jgi:hypothetical protein
MLTSKKNLFADYGVSKPQKQLSELEQLEEIIGRGRQSFVEVGEALARIRDEKLYLEKYSTFAEYCERRWSFKKTYAYDLIAASGEALKLPEAERPKTEREARKSLKIKTTMSAMADKKPESVPTSKLSSKKGIKVSMTTPEDEAAELLADVIKRIRNNGDNVKFLQALSEWLEESGL